MLALIDADIVLHRVCWTTENEDLGIAKYRADEMLDGILVDTKATEFQLWLSDAKENNFRYHIYRQYKANRVQPRPVHYETLKEYLISQWGARIASGMEADDALGIYQDKVGFVHDEAGLCFKTTIASIDKDLLTIPGQHWNFVKQEGKIVTPVEALRNFYAQFLIGDSADNIKGASGIGPKKAARLLADLTTEEDMFIAVVEAYQRAETNWPIEEILIHIEQIGQVLKIKQHEDEELWRFPESKRMEEILGLSSTQPRVEENSPSTEPIGQETRQVG